jgi:glycosyltransferase involved in cell wall biosynthesis
MKYLATHASAARLSRLRDEAVPLISVVMPVFDGEAFVRDAIKSVLEQTHHDLELIVVDDGSTDRTASIVSGCASNDRRLRFFAQPHSGKASIARNAGVARARAEFVAFIDADDLYHPRRLERGLEVLTKFPDVDVVFSDILRFRVHTSEDNVAHLAQADFVQKYKQYLTPVAEDIYRCGAGFYALLSTTAFGVVTPQTVMLRHSVLKQEHEWFPESMATYEDNDLWLRLAMRTSFAYIDQPLAYYRIHGLSVSANEERMLLGAIRAKTRNIERGRSILSNVDLRYCKKVLAEHYFSLGYVAARKGAKGDALAAYASSARLRCTGSVVLAMAKLALPRALTDLARQRFG